MALVADLAASTERGVAVAGFNVFGSLGFLTGIVIGGTVVDAYGYTQAFVVVGGLEVLLALGTVPVFLRLDVDREAVFTE